MFPCVRTINDYSRHHPRKRVIQYPRDGSASLKSRSVLDAPLEAGHDEH
jgi:hypothetical protein